MLNRRNANQRESGSGSSAKDHDELKLRLSNVNEQDDKRKESVKARMKSVKEVKIQRANYTEKQLLREKIKNMLLGAGWTIDYRPRRGRDYLDSVYISPSGSAYWSITKAYDALKKKEKDGSKEGGEFTPLPTEILSKLTRQTRKKLEREIENNGKHEGIGISRKSKRAKVKKLAHEKAIKLLERRREESGGFDKERLQKHGLKKSTIHTNSHIVHGEKNRLTLLVRDSEDNLVKRNLLSWLIDSGMISVGQKVEYMNLRRTRVMQEGWITEDGIHCDCCSKIITISRFELHARSKLGKPFENIFVKSGKSLMQCQIDGWNKQDESERKGFHDVDVDGDDPNDDTCGKCGDGGDLICCDGCPSTFHLSCLDMQMLPQGDWHCPNCACKYCERVGRYSTKTSGRFENSLLTCRLCEKKYHKSCCPDTLDMCTDSNDLSFRFCERKCREVYNHLQKILWVKHELDSGFSWYLIRRSDPLPESNSKLAVALSVMDECFLPIIDSRSGISLIHNVVYNCGSNFSRLNYSGFFTAILDKGDEMICAASIRIHGTQLAEMPFIGTRHSYRRQGMCRRLLNAIESALSSLKVEKLVIPAIEEHLHTWTNAFGFSPLEKSEIQEMRSINMLFFPGTDMLYKPLMNKGTSRANITSQTGLSIIIKPKSHFHIIILMEVVKWAGCPVW
ncbi:increased DNA methylation 1-like [Bidens hawaiensis]|uniref:increased DNA methylation 1-like n=1 Tax=Bidens hawaiensis TaxID=980011 RepID=UPI00404AB40C